MKTHVIYIAVILALLAAIWYLIDHNKAEQANRYGDNQRHQQRVEALEADIALSRDSSALLSLRLARDAKSDDSTKAVLLSEISGLKRERAILLPLVKPVIDSNPDLSALIENYDWSVAALDRLNKRQELACNEQIQGRDQIIRMQSYQVENAMALAESEKQRGDAAETAAFEASGRWGIGLQAGWGVMSSGGEVRTGPNISAGVTYKLLGFKRKR
jgi:hypothetical protein